MQCPICAALNREHGQECAAEATATLKRRSELIGADHGATSTGDQLDQDVLRSRKRQAHIAFELREHRTAQHPIDVVVTAASR